MTTKTYAIEVTVDAGIKPYMIEAIMADTIHRMTVDLSTVFGSVGLRVLDGGPPEPASEQDVRDLRAMQDERAVEPLSQYDP